VALKTSFLGINKRYFAPVFLRPYRKVHPDSAIAILLYQQLIVILIALCGVGYQYGCVFYSLLKARCADISGAACQVVACSRSPNLAI
jgi:hypothetical protein